MIIELDGSLTYRLIDWQITKVEKKANRHLKNDIERWADKSEKKDEIDDIVEIKKQTS